MRRCRDAVRAHTAVAHSLSQSTSICIVCLPGCLVAWLPGCLVAWWWRPGGLTAVFKEPEVVGGGHVPLRMVRGRRG